MFPQTTLNITKTETPAAMVFSVFNYWSL